MIVDGWKVVVKFACPYMVLSFWVNKTIWTVLVSIGVYVREFFVKIGFSWECVGYDFEAKVMDFCGVSIC